MMISGCSSSITKNNAGAIAATTALVDSQGQLPLIDEFDEEAQDLIEGGGLNAPTNKYQQIYKRQAKPNYLRNLK